MARKADQHLTGKPAEHGKKPNQKLKPYVVLQYLLKAADENHVATAYDIIAFLEECGIVVERRSIYRDIEDIKKVLKDEGQEQGREEVRCCPGRW